MMPPFPVSVYLRVLAFSVALWLDHDLDRGRSAVSASFASECLAGDSMGDFRVLDVEVWGVE